MFVNSYKFARLQRCSNCGQVLRRVANKTTFILLLIILIGAFLRLYNFSELLRFNNDQVRDAQTIDEMRQGEIPLLGPKAGGTKFNLGPAFYYLEYLSGAIFGFTPSGIALFIPILSVISIYLFYLLFKKIFSINIALALTFLYAISFYAIKYSHFAWNPNVIPFFVLAFLLLLSRIISQSQQDAINRVSTYHDFIFLGIIIGIGVQLHATLLILMPLFAFLTFVYLYFKKREINFRKILILFCIIIFLNLPFIYEAATNEGKNIQDFISGTQTKTESKLSILKNISNTAQFFLQGSTYQLSGIEPQKNWLNMLKLFKSRNVTEIILFLSSLLIFLGGAYLIFKKNKLTKNKNTLYLLVFFATLSFLLLIPVGNELNIRFFIIIQFLPYLLVGFIIQDFLNSSLKKIYLLPITFFILLISFFNLSNYYKTYNLNNYTAPESSYGGISLGELDKMCEHIKKISQENNLEKIYIENFEFKRSLEYICNKEGIQPIFLSQDKTNNQKTFFAIVKNENLDKNTQKYKENFELQNLIKIKRFTLLALSLNK